MIAPRPAWVVAAPYEATASFVAGCAFGPEAVCRELDACAGDPGSARPEAAPAGWVEAHPRTVVVPEAMRRAVAAEVRAVLVAGGLPLVVGGEHTVTPAALEAWDDRREITVLHFDAHADLRADYEGTPWNHACALRRVLDLGCPVVQIGIRSGCREEIEEVYGPAARTETGRCERSGVPGGDPPPALLCTRAGLRADRLFPLPPWVGSRVYLTVDLDALDPAVAPGVGTPEPDGLGWDEMLDVIDRLLQGRTLVGADVMELCPARDDGRTARLAARLLRRLAAFG